MKKISILFVLFVSCNFLFSQVDTVISSDLELIVKDNDWENAQFYKIGETIPYSGMVVDYYQNTTNVYLAYLLENGKQDSGWTRHYYEDGELQSEQLSSKGQAIRHGKFSSFYPNGQLEETGYYFDDLKNGIWKAFHENGSILFEQNYIKNKLEGDYKVWESDGELVLHENYKDGKLLKKIK